jgi:voltage-gated potassium channel Kch
MRAKGGGRERVLGAFGPLSLLLLILVWAVGLVFGFALMYAGLSIPVNAPEGRATWGTYVYMSGVTLFTLGFGDITPRPGFGRVIAVVQAGFGLGFLAVVIAYLPVLYQAFSRREVQIALLDARAGSPPRRANCCAATDTAARQEGTWRR